MQDSIFATFFKKRWVVTFLVFDVIVLLTIIIFAILNSNNSSTISFKIAPVDANIIINGNTYDNGTFSFRPGEYEIKVSHEGFPDKTLNINLESGHSLTVAAFLKADDSFTFYEKKENYDSYLMLADIASKEKNLTFDQDISAESFIEAFNKSLSLFDELPIIDQTPTAYGLDYGVKYQYDTLMIEDGRGLAECSKTLCLHITDTSGEKKDYALSMINKFGYNADDYEIIYEKVNYE